MNDIKKLPKWAQQRIEEAESKRNISEYGANIENVHVENNAIKHTEHTATAICSIAEALIQNSQANIANAEAIKQLAKTMHSEGLEVEFGPGIQLSDIRHR